MFSVRRMLPPGYATYYYSINDEKVFANEFEATINAERALEGALKLMELKVSKVNIIENIV